MSRGTSTDAAHLQPFSEIVGCIYDAALDSALWPRALDGARAYIRGQIAAIHWHDSVRPIANALFQAGIGPEWLRKYIETYLPLNPLQPFQVFCPVEEVHAGSELMSFEQFSETKFYKEWAQPQGLVDAVFTNLERLPTSSIGFAVLRGERDGLVDDETLRRMKLVVPHVRRAAAIGKVIDHAHLEASTLATATDALAAGLFLLDAQARLVHANAAGQAMLDTRSPVKTEEGQIRLAGNRADKLLHETIAAANRGLLELAGKSVSIPLAGRDGEAFRAHVLPLGGGYRAKAQQWTTFILFVRRSDSANAAAVAAFAARHGLTAQETRVLQAVVDAGSVPMAAQILGLAPTTVRTHVTGIFDKTGVRSQIDLIRLLVESASPFSAG